MGELEFRELVVEFAGGLRAVDGVNLTVPAGSIVGLVGESGSGKSTVARAAVGLAPVRSGSIRLNGELVGGRAREDRRSIQMIFQDPYSSLDPRMTIGDSIAESMIGATPRSERRAVVANLLERVRLEPTLASSYPSDISGGQRQRVSVARALAAQPEVVIADEVTSALDVSVQGAVLNLVRDVQRDLGLSMLFISHNLSVVRYVSDLIAVMYLGRVVEVGPTDRLIREPQHPYTMALVEAAAALDSKRRARTATHAASPPVELEPEPPDPRHPPPGCHYHPRCRLGPRVHEGRASCVEVDPQLVMIGERHRAACHVTAPPPATPTTDSGRLREQSA